MTSSARPDPVQLDALRLSEAIRERLVDFSSSDHFVRDPRLSQICRDLWSGPPSEGGLLSDLWVEGAFPAKRSSSSLATLVDEGRFNADLMRLLDENGAVPSARVLYEHQKESVLRCQDPAPSGGKPALAITAGTGAGKTECFLLPILQDLFQNPSRGTGVKCLILYPMNALVNDQVDRLYGWLRGQTDVRLFHFTSETPEDKKAADDAGVGVWDECRFRTRQEARGLEDRNGKKTSDGPLPDILITNYSMLEYMLCRPQDQVFFGGGLRAVVLDEAHLYLGTLAAEITMLLRRVCTRCGVSPADVLQLATSATLGTGSPEELRCFAATIFTKDPGDVVVIQGESERVPLGPAEPPASPITADVMNGQEWVDRPLVEADEFGTISLAESADFCDELASKLPALTSHSPGEPGGTPAPLLYRTLAHAPVVHLLEDVLWTRKRLPLRDLAKELWGGDEKPALQATIALLQLTASARPVVESYPLVPHRLHLLTRAAEGLSVCLNKECSGPENLLLPPLGAVHAGIASKCPYCEAAMLLIYRCSNCGEWVLAGSRNGNRYEPLWAEVSQLTFFALGSTVNEDDLRMVLNVRTAEACGTGSAGVAARVVTSCPRCGEEEKRSFRPFVSGSALTLAILAEAVLAELPAYPAAHNSFLPARGRRLLAFSDSRQEAARLGPRLTWQHDLQLVRAALASAVTQQLAADADTLDYIQHEIQRLERKLEQASTPALQQRIERDLLSERHELESHQVGGDIASWEAAISRMPMLAELLDAETAQSHKAEYTEKKGKPRPWSQIEWEKNRKEVHRQATGLLAREFATPSWRKVSTETLGLAEVTYPGLDSVIMPDEVSGNLRDDETRARLSEVWSDLLASLCDTLRVDGVVTLGSDTDDWGFETGGVPLGQWSARDDRGKRLERFVGKTASQRRLRFMASVLKSCAPGAPPAEKLAGELLGMAFDQLLEMSKPAGQGAGPGQVAWLEHDERQSHRGAGVRAIRIVFRGLGLRRPTQLYRCRDTGHIWPRSVAGCAPETGCRGTLEQVTEEELDTDPRVGRSRKEYLNSPVFRIGLWAEEHSAQLSPQENRRLQELFKAGIRNILSATTTLELGIDIGGLAAVLLGNVPPGKANYLQRAGRAGRRADGSAAVVTFSRQRPFDREVFRRFGDYLDQQLRKPVVFLDRKRVVRRHLHAYLLGEFFRSVYTPKDRKGAMDAFGNMGKFCGKPVFPYWKTSSEAPVEGKATGNLEKRFLDYLHKLRDYGDETVDDEVQALLRASGMEEEASGLRGLIEKAIEDFQHCIQDWNEDFEQLHATWSKAVVDQAKPLANAVRYQLKLLSELTVIEALADRQFLPSYGFPIGVQKLRVIKPDENDRRRIREEDQFRLERSGVLALGEYVPGSQIVASGKLITSHGLLKHWTGGDLDSSPGLRGQLCQCENDHWYYWISGEGEHCPMCEGPPKHSPQSLLFVKHGFTGAAWDPPKRSFEVERVGSTDTLCISFRPRATPAGLLVRDPFASVPGLRAEYREAGELLVFNRGELARGFAICLTCGYADSEKELGNGRMRLPPHFENHAPISSRNPSDTCWRDSNHTPVLRNQILAARETTDVLLLDFSDCLGQESRDTGLVTTLAYAFQQSGSRVLDLDSRELGVLIVPTGPRGSSWGAVVYDGVSGGAGHVRELLDRGNAWIQEAFNTLFVDEGHNRRCETGCLECLLSFDAQRAMNNRPFERKRAMQIVKRFVEQAALQE